MLIWHFVSVLIWRSKPGGMGIYGDFFFADVNRFGGGLAGRVNNIKNLTIGNLVQYGNDEKTNFGREATQFLRQNMPGGSIWYARLAWERMVLDQLQYLTDPDAHRAFRRKMGKRKRDYGQDFWWAPGESAPDHAPDMWH